MSEFTAISVSSHRSANGPSRLSLYFFGVALVALVLAAAVNWVLCRYIGRTQAGSDLRFPPAFFFSSALLLLGSVSLHRAVVFVRREKQGLFRYWLVTALICGAFFMGVQSYGLWTLFPAERTSDSASLGATAFVLCLATLHVLHFLIATLFVSFVISRTWVNRYDHEYYWGVRVCAWFWHFLGIVWVVILAVIAVAL